MFLAKAADNTNDKDVNMEVATEQDTNKGKPGNKNPLAFLGLKRVDVEDEDDDDKKSDDYDIEGKDPHTVILIPFYVYQLYSFGILHHLQYYMYTL